MGRHGNILWVNAGDADPPRPELVDAIAAGISETDSDALQTAHGAPETAAADVWADYPWLDVNNLYTYQDVYSAAVEQHAESELPYFLIESTYENEHGASTKLLRTQAYQALLTGAIGHVFGNNPMWHFDGPELFPGGQTWEDALTSPGTESMRHVGELFGDLPWWNLVPDLDGVLLVGDVGAGQDRAVAAIDCAGGLAVVYIPTGEPVNVNPDCLAGRNRSVRWFDPTSGMFSPAAAGAVEGDAEFELAPPGANEAGDSDWVAIIGRP